jgi:cytoskeletal protein RodZ
VREARERRGIGQRELSLETRIGIRYLEAIESMEVEALPRAVYLRAYVREVARVLGLDEERFVEDYLRAVEVLRTRPPLRRSPSAGGTEEPRRPEDEQDHLD